MPVRGKGVSVKTHPTVFMLSVVILSVIMLSVVLLSAMAPSQLLAFLPDKNALKFAHVNEP